MSRPAGVRWAIAALACAMLTAGVACRRRAPDAPPVATPSVKLSRTRVALGSPVDVTYTFVVASNARFDQDYRVMVHVLDRDDELMWTDDHNPPTPTSQWKPGQTIEYTRTIFVRNYPYVGDASIQLGLYSTATQKRLTLAGDDMGQHAYRIARLQLLPPSENVFIVFKDGWHPAEVAEHNASVEWQWTKKNATLAFKNPRKDASFYLEADNPGSVFRETQRVELSLNGQPLDAFTITPQETVLRRTPIRAAQFGASDTVELELTIDKTFVPSLVPAASSKDPRELGIRVFHAFIQPSP